MHGLSLVVVSGGYALVMVLKFLIAVSSLIAKSSLLQCLLLLWCLLLLQSTGSRLMGSVVAATGL